MYTHEWLPYCMVMGITPEQFWRMNPRLLSPYYEAEKIKQEQLDTQMWTMGAYVFEAVGTAVGNALRGKGKKAMPYRDSPFSKQIKEERGEYTEEEKMQKVNAIFNALQIMKVNYDLEKKFKKAE